MRWTQAMHLSCVVQPAALHQTCGDCLLDVTDLSAPFSASPQLYSPFLFLLALSSRQIGPTERRSLASR